MSKNNSLIDIAKILIDIKEERDFPKVPQEIKDRFPEGSLGININDEKWFVINTPENSITDEVKNEVKDYERLKYNSNFYFGTTGKEEVEIIDFSHNKGILINEAYTEVSFLPKDILSEAEFDRHEAKRSVEIIIDKEEIKLASSISSMNSFTDMFSDEDSDHIYQYSDYDVARRESDNRYDNKEVYDNVYRLRCVFNDIAGNEMLASILIKAYKVSKSNKDGGYRYEIIDNETVKAEIDKLEQTDNKKGKKQTSFSTIDESDYEDIRKRIEEGLYEYFNSNPDKYSRISSVDVKAIYCLRLKKVPIKVSLKSNSHIIGSMDTYYSMISNEFNVFECPTCSSLSNKGNGFKLHIDPDYIYNDDDSDELDEYRRAVGCDDCMVQCKKCGRWHFDFKHYDKIIESGYRLSKKRMFLESFVRRPKAKVEHYCSCGENLSWIYDELSVHSKSRNKEKYQYYSRIVDKFNTTQCKLVFVNQLTGEAIANHQEFRNFLAAYISKVLPKRSKEIYDTYKEISSEKDWVINFINKFETAQLKDDVSQGDDSDKAFDIRKTIASGIKEYKNFLAEEFHIDVDVIKVTSSENCVLCKTCGKYYCNSDLHFNSVEGKCHSCHEASSKGYRWWVRTSDNTMFYYSAKTESTIRTVVTSKGEELYDDWIKSMNKRIIQKLNRRRIK